MKILLKEDKPNLCHIIKDYLELKGHEVIISKGTSAIDDYDVAIVDDDVADVYRYVNNENTILMSERKRSVNCQVIIKPVKIIQLSDKIDTYRTHSWQK